MDRTQSKIILSALRPGGEEASEQPFVGAMEELRQDPELRQWFEDEMRLDASVRAALRAVPPPAGLRERILEGPRLAVVRPERVENARPFWRTPAFGIAAAAALVLLIGVAAFTRPSSQAGGTLTAATVNRFIHDLVAGDKITVGMESSNLDELRGWLAKAGAPHDFELPAGLRHQQSVVCQTYVIDGTKVSLVCFDIGGGREAHLFVMDVGPGAILPGSTPIFSQEGERLAASWSKDGHLFILTSVDIDEAMLRKLI